MVRKFFAGAKSGEHARPGRTVAPPTFACAGVRAPRCSLVRCPSNQRPPSADVWPPWRSRALVLPQGRCLGSRGFGLGSPLFPGVPLALAPGLRRGWRFNSGALSRTFLQLCAYCAALLQQQAHPAARLPRPAPPRGSPPLGPPLPLADASSGASGGASGEASERATDLPLPTVREASVDHLRPPSCRFASASLNEGSATFARRAPPAVRSVGDSTSAPSCRFRQARRLLYLRASRSPNRQVGERRGNAAAVLARPFSASG